MTRRDVPGTTYLLHLDPPYRHARHYLGFAEGGPDDLADRLAAHGGSHGARLLAVARAAGHDWHLTRTWPGTTRATERQIKNTRHVPHYCPDCQPQRSADRRTARQTTAARKDTAAMTTTDPAARLAFQDASRRITALYASGADLEQITSAHDDLAASLATDAQTGHGRAYAREYADTGRTLISDLRQDAAVAAGRSQAACTLPDGTPHPDPRLAAHGWQVQRGIYVNMRRAAELDRAADREAG